MSRNAPQLGQPENVVATVFGCTPDAVATDVVVSPFVPLKAFRRHLTAPVVELAPPFFYKGISAAFGDKPVSVIHTGVGPSRIGDCLGFLALTPARRVCFAGAVGSLHPQHRIGDFFIAEEAADGEGFTRYTRNNLEEVTAAAPRIPCDPTAGAELERRLTGAGFAAHRGRVFTIGSIAFESRDNLLHLQRQGFDAIEMELSAFFAAAAHYGFSASAVTYISDLPLHSSLWASKTATESDALRRAYRALPALCLDHATR